MIRPWHTWTAFGACLAVVLAAMGWISLTVIRLDRAEAAANRQAEAEESVRLALWRMESALGPLIAQESQRPYFAYRSFYPAERAYTRMFNELQPGEVLLPSPLLTFNSPSIMLHFQIGPDGLLTSPQVADGATAPRANAVSPTTSSVEGWSSRLAQLNGLIAADSLRAALPDATDQPIHLASLNQSDLPLPGMPQQTESMDSSRRQKSAQRSGAERQARVGQQYLNVHANYASQSLALSMEDVSLGAMKPLWMGQALLLARRVTVNEQSYIQGCRLNWEHIRRWLTGEVADLLPDADLEPVTSESPAEDTRILAALPVRLVPGQAPMSPVDSPSPRRTSLIVAWGCVLLSAGVVAVLLSGTLSLSERRAAFASAVTHEMRTPLTTFRMYTEMLLKGMVPDESKRRHYLTTLSVEAQRLGHLVENVLAYARLERSRDTRLQEEQTLRELIDRAKGRLEDRARQAGMNLIVEAEQAVLELRVRVVATAVEQILFNLVDNACKYAAFVADPSIYLEVAHCKNSIVLRVRDCGPGISDTDARRLFRPFSKSAGEAANSAPGVGLGLALSRRLARDMGGDLRLIPGAEKGACFVLELPMA